MLLNCAVGVNILKPREFCLEATSLETLAKFCLIESRNIEVKTSYTNHCTKKKFF